MNKELLENMWCPECGGLGPFRIRVTTTVLVCDNGTDDDKMSNGNEWDNSSYCECDACHYAGTVADFRFGEHTLYDVSNDQALEIAQKYAESLLGQEFYVGCISALTDKWEIFESSNDDNVLFKVRSKTRGIDAASFESDNIIDVALDVEVLEDPEGVLPKSMFDYRIFPRSYRLMGNRSQETP